MNIREISKPVTAKSLNESLAKRFGKKVALEQFTLEQLQDVRNKIRTTLSQVETNESFDTVQSEAYQKNKLFLDVLNAEIRERADVVEADDNTDAISTISTQPDNTDAISTINTQPDDDATVMLSNYDWKEDILRIAKMLTSPQSSQKDAQIGSQIQRVVPRSTSWKGLRKFLIKNPVDDPTVASEINKFVAGFNQEVVGETNKQVDQNNDGENNFDDVQIARMMASGMSKEEAMAKLKKKNESVIKEGAEDQAEIVMAAKDMVDRVTGWMEDTAEMQTESMLELADAIRDEMGADQAEQFTASVKPALEAMYGVMETTRQSLTQGVGMLTGESMPQDTMGDEPLADEPDMEPTVDADAGGEPADVSLDAAAPAAGGEEEAGRAKRESIQRKRKMIESSRKLGTILSKKK